MGERCLPRAPDPRRSEAGVEPNTATGYGVDAAREARERRVEAHDGTYRAGATSGQGRAKGAEAEEECKGHGDECERAHEGLLTPEEVIAVLWSKWKWRSDPPVARTTSFAGCSILF